MPTKKCRVDICRFLWHCRCAKGVNYAYLVVGAYWLVVADDRTRKLVGLLVGTGRGGCATRKNALVAKGCCREYFCPRVSIRHWVYDWSMVYTSRHCLRNGILLSGGSVVGHWSGALVASAQNGLAVCGQSNPNRSAYTPKMDAQQAIFGSTLATFSIVFCSLIRGRAFRADVVIRPPFCFFYKKYHPPAPSYFKRGRRKKGSNYFIEMILFRPSP